jgi:flagellar motor switch protein FliN/FliY
MTEPIDEGAEGVRRILKLRLPVSVVLAEKPVRVEDVLSMRPGDVLEFEKRVDDPLELVINQKPIANGVAVKSGEKFGVRVARVLGPQEKVRAMGPGL